MTEASLASGVRLAELLAPLSLATDLARDHPAEEAMRACLVATELGRRVGLGGAELADVYQTALLRFIGCTATSELFAATYGGDDRAVRRAGDFIDAAAANEVLAFLWSFTGGGLRGVFSLLALGGRARSVVKVAVRADCEVAVRLAARLGLAEPVLIALDQVFERWDGKGGPQRLKGDAISLPARITGVAYAAVMFLSAGGLEAATAAVRRWRGHILDPGIADLFLSDSRSLLEVAAVNDPMEAVIAAEPSWPATATPARVEEILSAFGDFADLKSRYLHGHSRTVMELADGAAGVCGLQQESRRTLRLAALAHDLGRVAVPTGTWDRSAPLTAAQWEEVRLHPYHSERILARSAMLRDVAAVAGRHHERMDGSGYHRGINGGSLDRASRVLAAADVFAALTAHRPHRQAMDRTAAARELEAMTRGRAPLLDAAACEAVLQAAGERVTRRRENDQLSEQETRVLRLLARGLSEKAIAVELHAAPSTVHTYVAHIYSKINVSTRAAAALYAMELGLLAG